MWGDFQIAVAVPGGHDTYVFGPHNGNDIIYDFHQGEDRIEIDLPAHGGGQFPQTFDDLNIAHVDANGDGFTDSVIQFGPNDSVTVLAQTVAGISLIAADVQFI
jgi:hypothetical protein